VLKPGSLGDAFAIYWEDVERCRAGRAYWSLLHVTICLPDICAALQADDGETSRTLYVGWCEDNLSDPMLSGDERYRMRCRVLHQGRASTGQAGRYTGFSFAQPASTGQVDHKRVEGKTLVLDVGQLSQEVRSGVEQWIRRVEAKPTSREAININKNLPSLVRVRQFIIPTGKPVTLGTLAISIPPIINRTS
jgi:hypothetical protein